MKKFLLNKLFTIILIAVAIIGVGKLIQKWSDRKNLETAPVLTDSENSKLIIDTSRKKVTSVTRDGDKQVIDVKDGVRDVVITVNKDGTISTYAPTKGFIFEPGISLGMDKHDTLLGVDIQWFYWRKLGLSSGIMAPPYSGLQLQDIRGYAAINYNLVNLKLPNTNFYVGYNTKSSVSTGVSIKF